MRLISMLCVLAMMTVGLPRTLAAQVDVIRGKVTSAEGVPLGNVRVTATSIPGNVTRTTRTDSRGSF